MIEVEVKAKINSFDEIKDKLNDLGAIKVKTEHQEDRYFNSPVVDFAKSDEALRIRETKTEESHNLFITYKGPKIDSKSKTREEVEMKNAAEYLKIWVLKKSELLLRIGNTIHWKILK